MKEEFTRPYPHLENNMDLVFGVDYDVEIKIIEIDGKPTLTGFRVPILPASLPSQDIQQPE